MSSGMEEVRRMALVCLTSMLAGRESARAPALRLCVIEEDSSSPKLRCRITACRQSMAGDGDRIGSCPAFQGVFRYLPSLLRGC